LIKAFIDKIENNIAEIHFNDNQVIYVNIKCFPEGIKEGDHLEVKFILDKTKTKTTKKKIDKLLKELSSQ